MNINLEFIWELLSKFLVQYNLRKGDTVYVRLLNHEIGIKLRESLLWNNLPSEVKK